MRRDNRALPFARLLLVPKACHFALVSPRPLANLFGVDQRRITRPINRPIFTRSRVVNRIYIVNRFRLLDRLKLHPKLRR